MANVVDYAGRKVDLLAFHGATAFGDTLLEQSLVPASNSKLIAGIEKLAQWVTLELLEEKGSRPYETRGTSFMTALRSGGVRTQLDLQQAFQSALVDVTRAIRGRETDDFPDDEKLFRVDMLSATLVADMVVLRLRVISRAGNSREILTPLAVSLQTVTG